MAAYFGVEKSALLEDRNHLPQDAIPYTPRPTKPIPIVGVVNCGMPLLAEDNIEGYIETPLEDLNSGEEYFWLRAKGDSMTNIGIHEGDFLKRTLSVVIPVEYYPTLWKYLIYTF